jgi:hypothetical protein
MKRKIFAFILAFCLIFVIAGCDMRSSVTLGGVLILGDSYSALEGYIPEGHAPYYGNDSKDCGVDSHKKMWWHILAERTRSQILLNSSYSGSTLCHTGYDGADYSEFSFSARVDKLIESGFFAENRVDTLVILGGLNDYWAGSPRGEIIYDGFTKEELYKVYPALSYIFSRAREASPETRIIYVSEEYLPDDMKADIREICAHYGADNVEIHGISKIGGHPDRAGMESIAEQIITYLEEKTR